jgi:NADH-quinone oxidoreductase subunit G
MITIEVDGTGYEVESGQNLLHACLSLGFDLPYFCWHPAMGSVGACRQCAVKQFHGADDQHGRIVMSCMTLALEGVRVSIADAEAAAFRASVIEWLMTNHPHDCPVCEEGGECHLQDMTVMTGHVYRRYRFKKRTFRNQYLGPFLTHEMNRCIACYRCVRFYRDYAGGRDFDVFAIHRNVYFGRHSDGVLENEFSGNLAEVCPTGVFDDKTFSEFYNRKWDLRATPSVCVHCGLGCNTTANERFGKLRRILNRYNHAVNGYFLCDRGRFGSGFVNGDHRIRTPLVRQTVADTAVPVSKLDALQRVAALLNGRRVIGIGSPRSSLEANFALRTLVGADRFHLGLSDSDHRFVQLMLGILRNGPARAASLHNAEQSDAVLVLGEDIPNTAPRLALSLRQAVRQASFDIADRLKIPHWQDEAVRGAASLERSPLFIATLDETRLDDVATATFRGAPDDLARLGFAVAREIDDAAPEVRDLSPECGALARTIAHALAAAKCPLVVAGAGCASTATVQAAANVAWALCRTGRPAALCLTVPECNSLGLGLMGGRSLAEALEAIEQGVADTLVVLENDLYRRADRRTIDRCLDRLGHLIVIDHVMTETTARAQIVLPAGSFAEADGTLVSNEGRAQRFFQLFVPEGDIRDSWRWLNEAMQALGRPPEPPWTRTDDVTAACAAALPALAPVCGAAPNADYRISGSKIPREPHRYSGRTAIHAAETVHEPKPPDDSDTPFAYSMEGYYGPMPPALIPYFWSPGWNSVQSLNKFQQEVGGELRGGSPGVRLIEPTAAGSAQTYFREMPSPFVARKGAWLVLPLHEVFGSEELSRWAPAVAERVPAPYVALSRRDASDLGVGDGAMVTLEIAGASHQLLLKVRPQLPVGVAGVFGPMAPLSAAWGSLAAVKDTGPEADP